MDISSIGGAAHRYVPKCSVMKTFSSYSITLIWLTVCYDLKDDKLCPPAQEYLWFIKRVSNCVHIFNSLFLMDSSGLHVCAMVI